MMERGFWNLLEPTAVCAWLSSVRRSLRLFVLELGRSVVRYVNDAGSEIHLSPTDLASPLPTQVEVELHGL
jgi:hypothetical protein